MKAVHVRNIPYHHSREASSAWLSQTDVLTVKWFFGVYRHLRLARLALWCTWKSTAREQLTTKTQTYEGSREEDRCVFAIRALMFSASDMLQECPV